MRDAACSCKPALLRTAIRSGGASRPHDLLIECDGWVIPALGQIHDSLKLLLLHFVHRKRCMRQIVYASRSYTEMSATELEAIATVAQRNNQRDGITGLLLYGDGYFFQVLEGEKDVIEDMKKHVWNDLRHDIISVIRDDPIEARAFPDWSMGCYRIDALPPRGSMWEIADLESIIDHLPPQASLDLVVLARKFFKGVQPSRPH